MYTIEERQAVHDRIVDMANADDRVVAAAVVGSLVSGGDVWSDLDLTFGVADDVAVSEVLEDWTARIVDDLDAVVMFDLPAGDTIYRVFSLPRGLQMDLSFTPASRFGAGGPRFRLLFGDTVDKPFPSPPPADELFGWAFAWARDAKACIERDRPWQAEHCISALRDHGLMLACVHRGLPARFGRGFDDLPPEVLEGFDGTLVRSLSKDELLRALDACVDALLANAEGVEAASVVGPRILEFVRGNEP